MAAARAVVMLRKRLILLSPFGKLLAWIAGKVERWRRLLGTAAMWCVVRGGFVPGTHAGAQTGVSGSAPADGRGVPSRSVMKIPDGVAPGSHPAFRSTRWAGKAGGRQGDRVRGLLHANSLKGVRVPR